MGSAAGIGQGVGAVGTVYGGVQQQKAGAALAGDIAKDTKENAARRRKDLERLKSKQTLGFLNSGVLLEGTPLLVLQETERLGAMDIKAGAAKGIRKAHTARRAGRDAFVSSLFQGGGQFASAAAAGM